VKPTEVGFVCVDAVYNRPFCVKLTTKAQITSKRELPHTVPCKLGIQSLKTKVHVKAKRKREDKNL
jgi:hypothetical protein